MIYEIINPSDPVTIDAPTFEAAALATILLANGGYGAKPIDEGESVPVFLLRSWRAWIKDRFGYDDAEQMLEERKAVVAATLRSAVTGSVNDRALFDEALAAITDDERRRAFVVAWNDRKRTSLTPIGFNAERLADWLEGVES